MIEFLDTFAPIILSGALIAILLYLVLIEIVKKRKNDSR